MTRLSMSRKDVVQTLGYLNVSKGLRRLNSWLSGLEQPNKQQQKELADFLEITKQELESLLEKDRRLQLSKRREERARDPHYYLTIRWIPAIYQTRKLPLELSRKEVIALARREARKYRKKCALNTPKNQTLWFNENGEVYAITEKPPYMLISGKPVTMNLI